MPTFTMPCPPLRRVRDDREAEARALRVLNRRLRLLTFSLPLLVLLVVGYQVASHLRSAVGALSFAH